MLRQLLLRLLAALASTLIAYAGGEALHLLFEHIAPDAPPVVYLAARLLTRATLFAFVVRIKLVITIRYRRTGPDDRK